MPETDNLPSIKGWSFEGQGKHNPHPPIHRHMWMTLRYICQVARLMTNSLGHPCGPPVPAPSRAKGYLEGWKSQLERIKTQINFWEDESNPDEFELAQLKHEREMASLEVDGWELALVYNGEIEVRPYCEGHIKDIQAKIESLDNSPTCSTETRTVSE